MYCDILYNEDFDIYLIFKFWFIVINLWINFDIFLKIIFMVYYFSVIKRELNI